MGVQVFGNSTTHKTIKIYRHYKTLKCFDHNYLYITILCAMQQCIWYSWYSRLSDVDLMNFFRYPRYYYYIVTMKQVKYLNNIIYSTINSRVCWIGRVQPFWTDFFSLRYDNITRPCVWEYKTTKLDAAVHHKVTGKVWTQHFFFSISLGHTTTLVSTPLPL